MSMGKANELLSRLGDGLADSVGIRPGESTLPQIRAAATAPLTDFVRDRSVGDIEIDKVVPDPAQPRRDFDEKQLTQLAEDLKTRGQLTPIRVRWAADIGKWMVISGERRLRAAQRAGLAKIKCIFIDRELTQNDIRSEQLVENLLREDLGPLEEARGYRSLMDLNNCTATDLAAALHVSKAKISRALALLKLPDDLQAKVEHGQMPATAAYELAKVKDSAAQRQLADQVVAGQIYTDTKKAAKAVKHPGGKGRGERKKPTNETFRLGDARLTIASRKHLGDQGMLDVLLQATEQVRRRLKEGQRKAG